MFKVHNKSEFIASYQAGKRDFRHTILTAINLTGSTLQQVILDESNLIEIDWSNCNLDRASLRKAYLGLSDFQNCHLQGANLQGANLEEANLENANLVNADLRNANLRQVNLKGANLQGAKLTNACLTGAIYDRETIFDRDFIPQTAGAVAIDTSTAEPSEERGTIQKILSWCRYPGSNPPK